MRNTALRLVLIASATVALLQSCKKDDLQSDFTPPSPSVSEADKLKDSTLAYARDIYLWYDKIPATFNARNYDDPNKIMTALRQYSSEPGFAQAVDRWSFAVNQDDWDDVSSGVSGDFGISVFFRAEGDLRVKMVEENSPAGRAGVQRGWRITKINGSTNMTTSNANAIVNGVYYSSASSFTFQKPDNSTLDMNLTAAVYQEQPVHLDTLYTINGARIGYMVFNSFSLRPAPSSSCIGSCAPPSAGRSSPSGRTRSQPRPWVWTPRGPRCFPSSSPPAWPASRAACSAIT